MTTTTRSEARRLVLQALYAAESSGRPDDDHLAEILDGDKAAEATMAFARSLYALTRENVAQADEDIVRLAHNWRLERLATIDRIILRMAITELEKMPDTPIKVVLNEAIELAKTYSTADSSSFINGILDSFIKNSSDLDRV